MSIVRLILLICIVLVPIKGFAQSFINPSHSGSGGVSFFLGAKPESAFYNPSFLMLTDHDETVALTFFSGSIYKSSGYTSKVASNPKFLLNPYVNQSDEVDFLFENNSNQLLDAWFGQNNSELVNIQQLDFITFGLLYKSTDMSFSLNHRLRGTTISQISRGWYDSTFNVQNEVYVLNRSLNQYSSYRHEIAIGFSWEQGLLSGLIGNRSAIYVGVNPKLILPVEFIDAEYQSTSLSQSLDGSDIQRTHSIRSSTSKNSCLDSTSNPFVCTTNSPDWSQITGIGAGFDAGITWRFSLGNTIRLRNDLRPVSDYQISLSLGVSDIGVITQRDLKKQEVDALEYMSQKNAISNVNTEYRFSPRSFFKFIESDIQVITESGTFLSKSDTYLTPTTLSAGIGLELNRIKLGMEYQQQTGNQNTLADFSSLHFGNEINLIPYLSFRSGFIIQPDEPVIYTAGFGLETSWLSLSASTMAKQLSTNDEFRPVMMNVGTLSLKF